MKQAFAKKGLVVPVEVPEPGVKNGCVKIKVAYSTISAGTEMMSVKGSGQSLISRVLQDPAKMWKVVDVLKSQGLKNAASKVTSAAEKLSPIGYSVAGKVLEVASDVDEFVPGDFVSAGGSGLALHADVVVVPKNLVVKVPNGLDLLSASTGTVGSIALHGVRRADLKIGEFGVVFGVGLLGLLALQILKASGVQVACVDLNDTRLALAKQLGADIILNPGTEDCVEAVMNWTAGHGADAVIFMAATDKDEPLSQAFRMCRRKGRVIMVGVSGMDINRGDIYANEIDFQISTSYGPGRYDSKYEQDGIDYPYAYVRWTERRNIGEFLRLIHSGQVRLDKLTPVVYPIDEVETAYQQIAQNPQKHLLTVLKFDPEEHKPKSQTINLASPTKKKKGIIRLGLIGAGSFATNTLLPIIYEHSDKFHLSTIVNRSGDKALNVANQFKAEKIDSDPAAIFNDDAIDLVLICTLHNSHAELVLESLKHRKHVFVEKPLATSMEQLNQIEAFFSDSSSFEKPILTVGFNRRFSIYAQEIKRVISQRTSPMMMHYRMNAGFVPYDSWVHRDGGRITGEACHIIDLMVYLTASKITTVSVNNIIPNDGKFQATDNKSISFTFADGSVGVLDYFSCGSKLLAKEYLELHYDNKSIILDDYTNLIGHGIKLKENKADQPRKGHKEEWLALHQCLSDGVWPIPLDELLHATYISILAAQTFSQDDHD